MYSYNIFILWIVLLSNTSNFVVSKEFSEQNQDAFAILKDSVQQQLQAMSDSIKKNEIRMDEMTKMMKLKDHQIEAMQTTMKNMEKRITSFENQVTNLSNDTIEQRLQHLEEMEKIASLRSCFEYQQYGIDKSDVYKIDPDGPLQGEAPFEVFCDFQNGTTNLGHDHEGPIEIDHCDGDMCFKMNINYSAPMSQIESLISLSQNCVQEMSYSCFLAPLAGNNGEPIGAWVSRYGNEKYYFTGSNEDIHTCDCGFDGSCVDSPHGYRCNCDADQPVMLVDTGTIDNSTALPITGFHYGNLQFESQFASIEVGKLVCMGQKEVDSDVVFDSCRNMKISGESRSGNYVLNSGRFKFCNFEKDLDDPDIEIELPFGFNDANSKMLFAASSHSGSYIPTGLINFDTTDYEYGECFDQNSATFEAPTNGLYTFSFNAFVDIGKVAKVYVYVNGALSYEIWHDDYDSYRRQLIGMWTMNLIEGDEVYLTNEKSTTIFCSTSLGLFWIGYLTK